MYYKNASVAVTLGDESKKCSHLVSDLLIQVKKERKKRKAVFVKIRIYVSKFS